MPLKGAGGGREEPKADILLVDDSPEKLMTLEVILAELGQNLVKASSGREALRHLLGREFAVVLLDVNMPGIDGFETAHLIRQRKANELTPIIFVTAFADDTHVHQGYSLGAVDYIIAPVIPEVLRSKVAVFVDLFKKSEQLRRQAAALERQSGRLLKLTEAALAINSAPTVDAILEVVAKTARIVAESDEAVALVTLDDPVPRVFTAVAGERPGERERLIASAAARSAGAPPGAGGQAPLAGAWLSAPLASRSGRGFGWLHARRRGGEPFTEAEASLMELLSQKTALAVENLLSAEAREANRLKDEFLTTLSHELRTPLTAILGWTRLLRQEPAPADRAAHALDVIERNVQVQAKLIDDLLDVSRIVSGKLKLSVQPVSLGAVVEAALEAVGPSAEGRGVALAFDREALPAPADRLAGDSERLQQVVLNLLSNAVKFTPRGGSVTVTAARAGERFTLAVKDTGRGIAPSFLPHVFDRFRQGDSSTTRRHGGLGIGLSLVKHIVELHGGTVTAFSEGIDKGSLFTVSLPATPAPRVIVPRSATVERPTADLSGLSVLLVDDEGDAREVVREVLARAGAEVVTAASVREAMELLPLRRPDVVLSDIAMPDEDGFSLVRALREREGGERLGVIALSAYTREEDVRTALKAGFDRHVGKPVEPEELAGAVAEVARARAAPQPLPPRRILVVEDNRDSREALKALLEMSGHSVEIAETGTEAVEKALASRPDVAVVDIGLPEMDGFEVARRIRDGAGPRMLLVALTGYDGGRDRSEAASSGFDVYLAKPVNVQKLDGILARTGARR